MICDRRFISVRKRLFSAGPGCYLTTNFLHFGLVFFKMSAKLSPCFTDVDQITICTWSLVDGMGGVKLVSFVLWINKLISDDVMWAKV